MTMQVIVIAGNAVFSILFNIRSKTKKTPELAGAFQLNYQNFNQLLLILISSIGITVFLIE